MKSDDIKALAIILTIPLVAICVTNERDEWSIGIFIFNLFVSIFLTGFACLVASCTERVAWKLFVFFLYVFAVSFLLDSAKSQRTKRIREQETRRIRMERYEAWYNSLTPYQKLQEDNERLREENALLQQK